MDKTKNRNDFVDIMRGIAMLMVVLGHTMTGCTEDSEKSFLFNVIWSLQMPLFILISGYVTRYSRGVTDGKSLWKYIKRRTVAYLLPWCVWTLVVRGLLLGQSDFLDIKYLLWHMDNGYWFLFTIWTISIFFGIAEFVSRQLIPDEQTLKRIALLTAVYIAGMAVLTGIGVVMGLSFLCIKLTLYYMPFYWLGFFYGKVRDHIFEYLKGAAAADITVAVSLFIWLLILTHINLYEISDRGSGIVVKAFASVVGCVAVIGLCKSLYVKIPNWGGYSLAVGRCTQSGDIFGAVSGVESSANALGAEFRECSRNQSDADQLCDNHDDIGTHDCAVQSESHIAKGAVWQMTLFRRIAGMLDWAGLNSLEIYLIHGFVLNILKLKSVPHFNTISGICLVGGNYFITIMILILMTALLNQSFSLRFVLFGKRDKIKRLKTKGDFNG